ncbi:MAG TPA: hypothetical protein PK710_19990 [Polyangiaceae bacterium]|nr:MAG: hypothetical protein BWY17_04126 [Deltaproteobacteria bacterium ADurb.Bin207]HOT12068.1 hypothetical protein [Polyangiaceae bacterium]
MPLSDERKRVYPCSIAVFSYDLTTLSKPWASHTTPRKPPLWVALALVSAVVGCAGRPAEPVRPNAAFVVNIEAVAAGDGAPGIRFDGPTGEIGVLRLERDDDVAPGAMPLRVENMGQIGKAALLVMDTNPSVAGPMSHCQAGEEQFLRVVNLKGQRPIETFRLKTASCRANTELAAAGIKGSDRDLTLTVEWLLGPKKGNPQRRIIRFDTHGNPISDSG